MGERRIRVRAPRGGRAEGERREGGPQPGSAVAPISINLIMKNDFFGAGSGKKRAKMLQFPRGPVLSHLSFPRSLGLTVSLIMNSPYSEPCSPIFEWNSHRESKRGRGERQGEREGEGRTNFSRCLATFGGGHQHAPPVGDSKAALDLNSAHNISDGAAFPTLLPRRRRSLI